MPEYRHLQTINKGITGPDVTQNVSNTYTGVSPLIDCIYIPNNMGTASADPKLLGSFVVSITDFMADYGSMMRITGTFKRGAVAEARAVAITIGSMTYAESLLLVSDSFGAEDASEETYRVSVELIRTGLNTVTFESSVKALTLSPAEEDMALTEDAGFTMPASPVIAFWGTNADSGSVTLTKAILEYYPISS